MLRLRLVRLSRRLSRSLLEDEDDELEDEDDEEDDEREPDDDDEEDELCNEKIRKQCQFIQNKMEVRLCLVEIGRGEIFRVFLFVHIIYLLDETDPRLLLSLPRVLLRLLSLPFDFNDVGDSERTRFALNRYNKRLCFRMPHSPEAQFK